MSTDPIMVIRARQAATVAKLNRLRPQLQALELQLQEYETAIKVLEQLPSSSVQDSAVAGSEGDATMPELILRALAGGPKPIAEVTAAVTAMSDKSVDANNVRSTTWRMWKVGRIEKTGDNYHLIGQSPQSEASDIEDSP